MLSTGALIASALVAAGSAAASAYKRNQASKEEQRSYQEAKDFLNSQYYRDPLTTVGNRSLIKAAKETYDKNLDAINNRMAAGGGTMENALAARQSNNEGMGRLYGQLLQGEDARRDRINAQKLQLDQNHSSAVQANFRQAAQDWQQWGAQTSSALLSYGSSQLLGGELSAKEWSKMAPGGNALLGMAQRIDNEDNPIMQPILGSGPSVSTPGVTGPAVGGLRGVNR